MSAYEQRKNDSLLTSGTYQLNTFIFSSHQRIKDELLAGFTRVCLKILTLPGEPPYIHNWPLQPFSQDYWPNFSPPLMLCVLILYISGGIYSLKSIPNDKFFLENFSWQFYLLSECCQKSAERKPPKKYFLYFVLMSGLGLVPWFYVQ